MQEIIDQNREAAKADPRKTFYCVGDNLQINKVKVFIEEGDDPQEVIYEHCDNINSSDLLLILDEEAAQKFVKDFLILISGVEHV